LFYGSAAGNITVRAASTLPLDSRIPGIVGRRRSSKRTESTSLPLIEQAKYPEAIHVEERVVEAAKRAWGSEHPETVKALLILGLLFQKTGEYTKAEALLQEALRIRQKVLGPKDPDTCPHRVEAWILG
jgi:hypothetical protein